MSNQTRKWLAIAILRPSWLKGIINFTRRHTSASADQHCTQLTPKKTLLCSQLTRWLTALRKRWWSSGVQISRGRFPLGPFCMSPESEPSEAASLRGDLWGQRGCC